MDRQTSSKCNPEENTLATKKRQFKKGTKEANFLKQCCNVQKQEQLVSLFFLRLSQNLLGKKGNTFRLFFPHVFIVFTEKMLQKKKKKAFI
jgi:hypothetical protein